MRRTGRQWVRLAWGMATTLGVVVGFLPAGCDDPAARARVERRGRNLNKTIRMMQDVEAAQPRSLRVATDAVARQHDKDLRESAANPGRVNTLLEQDFTRFRDRQPLYRREIDTQLKGKPDAIPRTFTEMVY